MINAEDQPNPSLPDAIRRFIETADKMREAHRGQERPPMPGERLYFDLRETEQTFDADLMLRVTEEADGPEALDFPPGVVISANRRAHGADVHLTWDQASELRDTLTQLLREAGQE